MDRDGLLWPTSFSGIQVLFGRKDYHVRGNKLSVVPKPGCFKQLVDQLFAILRGSALLCSFALSRLRSFALMCVILRTFACFCVRRRLEQPRLGTAEYNSKS